MTKAEAREVAKAIYENLDEDITADCEGDPEAIAQVRRELVVLLGGRA
jgi:hypothetical protein